MTQHAPDVAFGLHPDLGVMAIVNDADAAHYLTQVLDEHGFDYQEQLDVSVLPRGTPHSVAVRVVENMAWELHCSGWTVAVDATISLPTVVAPHGLSAAAPTRTALPGGPPEERARVRAATAASPQFPTTAPSDPPPPAPPSTAPPRGAGPTR
ncbi:hypothetical protein [Streptomyces sp. NPDC046860]|uniref:hypothetical protein n=1 Tax=Streptomyces sp. NPDC046860 TaxID=3154495 RepID=UPI0033E598DD